MKKCLKSLITLSLLLMGLTTSAETHINNSSESPGEPIFVPHTVTLSDTLEYNKETGEVELIDISAWNAMWIDTLLTNYNNNNNLAEGTIFELEGGKVYYFKENPSLNKGFTMRTRPSDLKKGKGRAKIYLGGLWKTGTAVKSSNFMLGRQPVSGEDSDVPIYVKSLIFEEIDWDCPLAEFFNGEVNGTGNYFANMYSNGMPVTFQAITIRNCSFQRMVRGFICVQGTKRKIFENVLVENCEFKNCGYYDNNGRGYAWVAGDGKQAESNIFNNMVFQHNTFYDSPRTAFFTDNGKNLAWPASVKYNVTFNNNTVINFSTRNFAGNKIFDFRYLPAGSTITCENNLFVLTKDASDERNLNFGGMDIRQINGDPAEVTFNIRNNWSTNTNLTAGQIFTSGAFSNKKNSAGKFTDMWPYGKEELEVHVCDIAPEDLFVDPNPKNYEQGDPAKRHWTDENLDDILRFKNWDNDIVKNQVGAAKWNPAAIEPPGEPIYVPHTVTLSDTLEYNQETGEVELIDISAWNAMWIDTLLTNYNNNNNLAEGTIFELEGGKVYYFKKNPSLYKGFTMRTRPSDLEKGKGRAKVYLGGLWKTGTTVKSSNFMLGRQPVSGEDSDVPIYVKSLIFEEIDWDCPLAEFFNGEANGTGNYFANMYSNGMPVTFQTITIRNCSFQHMVRGFIRVQGSKRKVFENVFVENCEFKNCGYYDNNGRGYAWVAGDGMFEKSNIFNNMVFQHNTFYDSPRTAFFTDNGKNLAWPANVKYNITFNNNTVINFSTRNASGNKIFDLRYLPAGSTITCENNLFVLTKDASDERNLYFGGMDIRQINGDPAEMTFNIRNNWSTNTNLTAGQIFTAGAFSATKNSAGKYTDMWPYGKDELEVKVCDIAPEDLFVDPNPKNYEQGDATKRHWTDKNLEDILKFKNWDNDIVKNQVGAAKWLRLNPAAIEGIESSVPFDNKIVVYNLAGNVVKTSTSDNPSSGLKPGVYLIKHNNKIKKVIKK